MNGLTWTVTQVRRFKELGMDLENLPEDFSTPVIISKSALAKMTIDESHPLFRQVYWINRK
ncbi:MAG: hypothetical protein KAS28_03325 [Desulfobacula sp.]|nr:hypothetical protein [Desulfobacula sp.]